MRPRFQADADLNHKIILALRRREPAIDFQDARQGGVIGEADPDVLAIAADAGRILVHDRSTTPRHFAHFTAARSSPGLIVVNQRAPIAGVIEDLLLTWPASESEEWMNKVGYVPM